jgi:hypothetical protein
LGADLPTLLSLLAYSLPPLPSFERIIASWGGMEGERSITSGNWLNYKLAAMSSAVDRIPPTPCPLRLYQEFMENCGWAHLLYQVHGRIEKLPFIS